jgi:hypothetical protein
METDFDVVDCWNRITKIEELSMMLVMARLFCVAWAAAQWIFPGFSRRPSNQNYLPLSILICVNLPSLPHNEPASGRYEKRLILGRQIYGDKILG